MANQTSSHLSKRGRSILMGVCIAMTVNMYIALGIMNPSILPGNGSSSFLFDNRSVSTESYIENVKADLAQNFDKVESESFSNYNKITSQTDLELNSSTKLLSNDDRISTPLNGMSIEVKTTKVYVLPDLPSNESTGEYGHFILDGLNRSHFLERVHDIDDSDAVWVVDLVRISCFGELLKTVEARWERSLNNTKLANNTTKTQGPRPWKIYFLDMDDHGYRMAGHCARLVGEVMNSTDHVHLASRDRTGNRNIYHDDGEPENKTFANVGREKDYIGMLPYLHGKVRVLRYGVRSDLVECIEQIRRQDLQEISTKTEYADIITLPRINDVAHFWGPEECGGAPAPCQHRNFVSKALFNFSKEPTNSNRTIFVGLAGNRGPDGRKFVQKDYAKALLQYKIIVVSQRDGWEDHYRLMEGLAGGAMVMTDPMTPLPYHIEDKKQVIVYESIAELKELIHYYLENEEERLKIASSGHEVAMRDHRSWTWMERLIFGDWMTEHGSP